MQNTLSIAKRAGRQAGLILTFSLWWLGYSASVSAEVAVPVLQARVTDLTHTLSPTQTSMLEQKLRAFEASKGSQIAVLLVPSTAPETIEQYALRVAEQWRLGRKGVDDGVVVLVAMQERALRLEVGYGLEGVIPDAIAKRIISEIMIPFFKQGDYYGGLNAGVDRLIRLIDGEPLPPPKARDASWSDLEGVLPLLFIGVVVIGGVLRALFGQFIGAAIVGTVVGLVFWFFIGSLLLALLAAFIAFIFTIASVGRSNRRYRGMGGGFSRGGLGGGFRGGGGGFGGGGASGRW